MHIVAVNQIKGKWDGCVFHGVFNSLMCGRLILVKIAGWMLFYDYTGKNLPEFYTILKKVHIT